MQSELLGATATSTAAHRVPCKTREGSRDVEAETAALSLARRRGKCAPSVDTKLADAWLGFYVALTKSSSRPTEAATQASTEAATEASLSEVASSVGFSPRHGDTASEPLTGHSLSESWADASEESPSPKKRSRRSHRRRRTRGRGKKGRSSIASGDGPEEECTPIDEEDDSLAAPSCEVSKNQLEASVLPEALKTQCPFQPVEADNVCPRSTLPVECLPISSPSKACKGAMGMLTGTSPNAVNTPTHCEASARTPPRVAFASSPVACMMPSTPTAFGSLTPHGLMPSTPTAFGSITAHGVMPPAPAAFSNITPHSVMPSTPTAFGSLTPHGYNNDGMVPSPPTAFSMVPSAPTAISSLTYQGGHAAYQGSHMMLTSGSVCVGTPCYGEAVQVPTFFGSTAMVSPMVDAMRSWLAGSGPSNDTDLAMRLHEALPEVYED